MTNNNMQTPNTGKNPKQAPHMPQEQPSQKAGQHQQQDRQPSQQSRKPGMGNDERNDKQH